MRGQTRSALGDDDRLQVAHGLVEPIALIDDHVVVLAHALHLALGGRQADAAAPRRVSVPRAASRGTSSSSDGGRRKTVIALGSFQRTVLAPWTSGARMHVLAAAQPVADAVQRDTVAVQVVDDRVLEELVRCEQMRRTRLSARK